MSFVRPNPKRLVELFKILDDLELVGVSELRKDIIAARYEFTRIRGTSARTLILRSDVQEQLWKWERTLCEITAHPPDMQRLFGLEVQVREIRAKFQIK